MVLVYVDSGVRRFAGLLQIVCHAGLLSSDVEAPLRASRQSGEAVCVSRREVLKEARV
jgi:hypothetical protein